MCAEAQIRVIVVDDHTVVLDGLTYILMATDDIHVVATTTNGERAVSLCNEYRPDVVLMDLIMPNMDGIKSIEIIHDRFPDIKLIALTSFYDESLVYRALQVGATSYLVKNLKASELTQAIRAAYRGQSTLAPEAAQALVHSIVHPTTDIVLTEREQEVLNYLVDGLTNAQIAEQMIISRNTVSHHVRNILGKLDAVNRTEAVRIAMERNLVI